VRRVCRRSCFPKRFTIPKETPRFQETPPERRAVSWRRRPCFRRKHRKQETSDRAVSIFKNQPCFRFQKKTTPIAEGKVKFDVENRMKCGNFWQLMVNLRLHAQGRQSQKSISTNSPECMSTFGGIRQIWRILPLS